MIKNLKKGLSLAFIPLGVVFFIWLLTRISREELASISSPALPGVVLAALITVLIALAVSWRWRRITGRFTDTPPSWWEFFQYFVFSRFMGTFLPRELGEAAVKTTLLHTRGALTVNSSMKSVLLDRVCDLGPVFFMLLGGFPFWLGLVSLVPGAVLMLLTTAAGGLLLPLLRRLPAGASLGPLGRIKLVDRTLAALRELNPRGVLVMYYLSMTKTMGAYLRLAVYAWALGLSVSPLFFLLGGPFSQMTFFISFLPGGLGLYEAGWMALFALRLPEFGGVELFLVAQRVYTTALIIGLTLICQAVVLIRKSRGRSSHGRL